MNNKGSKTIFIKCKSNDIIVNHVCEVGVYLPQTSNILDFIQNDIRTTLVEPDPKNILAIQEFFKGKTNIQLFPCAVFDYNGTLELTQREASTFVSSLKSSPAIVNDHYLVNVKDTFTVPCKKFDEIDDGTIDLLSIDTEGCEWYVLMNIKSRPKVISVETHGKSYVNPFLKDINNWVSSNGYCVWYKDKSDTVYIKRGILRFGLLDILYLILYDFYLGSRSLKYKIKRFFKRG